LSCLHHGRRCAGGYEGNSQEGGQRFHETLPKIDREKRTFGTAY
jgi:hypothetical protein